MGRVGSLPIHLYQQYVFRQYFFFDHELGFLAGNIESMISDLITLRFPIAYGWINVPLVTIQVEYDTLTSECFWDYTEVILSYFFGNTLDDLIVVFHSGCIDDIA